MELSHGRRRRGKFANPKTHFSSILFFFLITSTIAQDYDEVAAPPPEAENCDGIFISYTFLHRTKVYPHVKNASAQAWAFESLVSLLNTGKEDLQGWNLFIGFQHGEILVSASGAVLTEGTDLPANVENGTSISGFPQTDLKNSIETAGDFNQIQVEVQLKGTQFGLRDPSVPMPRSLSLLNDGFFCPKPTRHGSNSHLLLHLHPISISVCQSIYLSIHLSIFLYIYQSIYLYLSDYLSIDLSVSVFVYLSTLIYRYIHLSIYMTNYLSTYLSIYMSNYIYIYLSSIYLSIYLSVYLSVCLSIYLSTINRSVHFYLVSGYLSTIQLILVTYFQEA